METVIGIISLIALFIFCYLLLRKWSYDKFQKEMKENDPCIFYVNETKYEGIISSIFENEVVIRNAYGLHKVSKTNVYPIWILW